MKNRFSDLNIKTTTLIHGDFERTTFVLLSLGAGVSFFLYLFLVGSTIFNVVERKNAEITNRSLETSVSELELVYLSESKRIDMALAKTLGFKEANRPAFASRATLGKAPSLAQNEI